MRSEDKRSGTTEKRNRITGGKKASLINIEMLKQFGITLTEEQKQEMLKCTLEQQGLEE